ncbi:MAG: KamA family radical SAM protein [Syntrophales bacterium]|nr:KamA family radical SAM protein [Syntrophales bacterium]
MTISKDDIPPERWSNWKWQFKNRVSSFDHLCKLLPINGKDLLEIENVIKHYPISITPHYFSLIREPIHRDPIFLQCVPQKEELDQEDRFTDDPLEERYHMPVPGLLHRYPDRCLIITTNICAVYCRYCNRKRLWKNEKKTITAAQLKEIVQYIREKPGIREVILSGGDPLIMNDEKLDRVLFSIKKISTVEVIRIGSRIPVTLPMRITEELTSLLKKYRPLWFNTQFNNPREITPEAAEACERLVMAGIPLSCQTVLLRGINDNPDTLKELFYNLQRLSVRPYYLFHPEPVKGTRHFQVPLRKGIEIMDKLRREISGLSLPLYVLDTYKGKIPLSPHLLRGLYP